MGVCVHDLWKLKAGENLSWRPTNTFAMLMAAVLFFNIIIIIIIIFYIYKCISGGRILRFTQHEAVTVHVV